MKKILGLLSVLTISGTAVPTTIAASSYQKEKIKLEDSYINYLQTNNSESLNRNKRHFEYNHIANKKQQIAITLLSTIVLYTRFNLGRSPSDNEIIDAFFEANNLDENLRGNLRVSSRMSGDLVRISVVRNNNIPFEGTVTVSTNSASGYIPNNIIHDET